MRHIKVATTTTCSQFGARSNLLALQISIYKSNDPTLKQFFQKMAAIAFCPHRLFAQLG